MDIAVYRPDSIDCLHQLFRGYRCHAPGGWWFRGHVDADWKLVPKAGRQDSFLTPHPEMASRDLGRFYAWREQAVAYSETLPENDWECLAVAQHHGLATRLLDWTQNPLVATFFAVWKRVDLDGAVFCYFPERFIDKDQAPLDMQDVGVGFRSRAFSPRILNQRGVFTYHGPPNAEIPVHPTPEPIHGPNLVKIVIKKELKVNLLQHLDDYGVNNVMLFPDLDGLSVHINWQTQWIIRPQQEEQNR